MLETLKTWKGKVNVNGVDYNNISDVKVPENQPIKIILYPVNNTSPINGTVQKVVKTDTDKEYRFTVKGYMTKPSTPGFDFMEKWNHNNPMPLRTMIGTVEKETRGMVYVHLHGDIYAEKICTCMACGKTLTNPVSQYFGIGPECGHHGYVNPFDNDEELRKAVEEYKAKLRNITWDGWIIKSAVLEQVEV